MDYYQLTYLIDPERDVESIQKELTDLVEQHQGDLESQSDGEQVPLGHPIKPELKSESVSEAIVGTISFYLNPDQSNSLKEKINEIKGLLRTMLVSKQQPSPETEQPQQEEQEPEKVELEDIDKKLDEILEE